MQMKRNIEGLTRYRGERADGGVRPYASRVAPDVLVRGMRRQHGFSMIEMLIAVGLRTAVLGVVVKGMTDMQRRSFSESSKMDSVQDTRDFIDQMVRDVHSVGYPPPRVIGVVGGVNNVTPYCTDPQNNGVPN